MKNSHLIKASEILGSQALLAKAIGVTQPTLNQWISGDRPVPIERCVLIEQATNGQVTRKDLRPDDWHRIWPELVDVA